MKIGDLVEEYDPCNPQEKFPLGIVIPFPSDFLQDQCYCADDYENGALVWVRWPELSDENWCYVDELRLLNENR